MTSISLFFGATINILGIIISRQILKTRPYWPQFAFHTTVVRYLMCPYSADIWRACSNEKCIQYVHSSSSTTASGGAFYRHALVTYCNLIAVSKFFNYIVSQILIHWDYNIFVISLASLVIVHVVYVVR